MLDPPITFTTDSIDNLHSLNALAIRFTYYKHMPRTLRHWTPGLLCQSWEMRICTLFYAIKYNFLFSGAGVILETSEDEPAFGCSWDELLPKRRRVVTGRQASPMLSAFHFRFCSLFAFFVCSLFFSFLFFLCGF